MPIPVREGRLPNAEVRLTPKLTASGGEAKIVSLDVHELKSVFLP